MPMKRVLGILSLALLIFAFMFSVTTQSGYCLGDNVLRSLGIKAWSLESAEHSTNGFHYTFLFSLAFAIMGYAGSKHFLKELYPRLVDKLFSIIVILFFISAPLFNWGYGIVLSFSQGVDAVDYLPRYSTCNYTINNSFDLLSCSYQITLKNYSREAVKFNMQVQKPGDYDAMLDVTGINAQGGKALKEFVLGAGEQRKFSFTVEDQNPESHAISGNMNQPNIAIFDHSNRRQFIVH
ncbi:MAG: hypothetical protein ABFD08_18345 [Syntrophomonas sp.]